MKRTLLGLATLGAVTLVSAGAYASVGGADRSTPADAAAPVIPLKEAKLNIEHNATDEDTGFQGFIDSEGWTRLNVRGPDGEVLQFQARGDLAELGMTELFFETVEPANADVDIEEILETLPEGEYTIAGAAIEDGEPAGRTAGTALLTHDIPAGPELLTPADGDSVPLTGVVMSWGAVTETIDGGPVTIVAYQLIVEKVGDPPPHMIGKPGSLSMYLPPTTTSITLPDGFLEAGTDYAWEVLAIEESGNQTLSSGEFHTQ
jgi:hypothetical protein